MVGAGLCGPDHSLFVREWFAGGTPMNQLPISSVCNCHCLFCSNELNPFAIHKGKFRPVEDVKLQLAAMPQHDEPLRLSDSLPGRISEGEALVHPKLFEILDVVRARYFYNQLCFTTNASMLDEAFLRRLAAYRPIEVTVSMHSTQPALWARVFRRGEGAAATAVAAPGLLKRFGMDLIGTIVPLPRLCGWDDIERTYGHLVEAGAKRMILYRPGVTVRTPPELATELACDDGEFGDFAARMRARFDVPLDAFPDMAGPLAVPAGVIAAKTLTGNPKTGGREYGRVAWLASAAAAERLRGLLDELGDVGNQHAVVATRNHTYGGNVSAAGLLMVDDFVRAGEAALEERPDTALFLVPAAAFDSLRCDLTGEPAYRIAERLGRPAWIVGDEGTVDPLLSPRLVKRRPALDPALVAAVEAQGAGAHGVAGGPAEGLALASSGPLSRRFEVLDAGSALCLETWAVHGSASTVRRWTRLVKSQEGWTVADVEEGGAG
jgi:hypothetical protein